MKYDLTPDEENSVGVVFGEAVDLVRKTQRASSSVLQRRLRIGYIRASRCLEVMERLGMVGPEVGATPREVYIK